MDEPRPPDIEEILADFHEDARGRIKGSRRSCSPGNNSSGRREGNGIRSGRGDSS